jgi:hypothetical protein
MAKPIAPFRFALQPADPALSVGDELGPHKISALIGAGGLGKVFWVLFCERQEH